MATGERHIEMSWRCSSCQARNLGRFKVCQSCRNPKDGSEAYEMPEDTSKAATVTEESLLRMASAGPDWRCAYCGGDQRATDLGCASCGASALEGEEATDGPEPAPAEKPPAGAPAPARPTRFLRTFFILLGCGALGSSLLVGGALALKWNQDRPRDYQASATDLSWERVIEVDRWQLQPLEGFKETLPAEALEVSSLGQRQHHTEEVLDHYDTEHYTVDVPDGYRTESYSERVSCGQDCTTSSRTCRESCTSSKNGFAKCKQVCSGGGRSCTTRYCDKRRTRQVPKTRADPRTRQVPRYRTEPRFAEAFGYKLWQWVPVRTVRARGTDVTVRWPEAELGKNLGPGQKERERRTESYSVSLSFEGQTVTFNPSAEVFVGFAPGTKHAVHTENGRHTVDGLPIAPSP